MNSKICPDCEQTLSLDNFSPDTRAANGLRSYCRPCNTERTKKYYARKKAENPDYVVERREWNNNYLVQKKKDPLWVERYREKEKGYAYKKKYNITLADKVSMLEQQNYKCLMCDKEMKLDRNCHVDHSHETGVVRGLLCGRCNGGLAYIEDTNFLERAKEYLEKYE